MQCNDSHLRPGSGCVVWGARCVSVCVCVCVGATGWRADVRSVCVAGKCKQGESARFSREKFNLQSRWAKCEFKIREEIDATRLNGRLHYGRCAEGNIVCGVITTTTREPFGGFIHFCTRVLTFHSGACFEFYFRSTSHIWSRLMIQERVLTVSLTCFLPSWPISSQPMSRQSGHRSIFSEFRVHFVSKVVTGQDLILNIS